VTAGTSIGLELERRFALQAVAEAALVARAVRAELDPREAATKADHSPVTVADLASQALVRLSLAETLPADGLMGEEDSRPLAADPQLADAVLARGHARRPGPTLGEVMGALDRCDDPGGPVRRWWALDPIDGTKGFLRDEQYAVALALIEDGAVVLAAMACPNLPLHGVPAGPGGGEGCLFVAERGAGARMLRLVEWDDKTAGDAIAAAIPASPPEARYAESVEAGHSDQSGSARIARALGITAEPLRLDSQTKYAVVARGDASIYLRLPHGDYRENVWDHAAGWLIVSEAGGRVSDVDGRPLDFTTGRRMTANRGVVATAAPIHGAVLEAVRSVLAR
jgi:3'(2'), 5'-bisphosphate nucleotidase